MSSLYLLSESAKYSIQWISVTEPSDESRGMRDRLQIFQDFLSAREGTVIIETQRDPSERLVVQKIASVRGSSQVESRRDINTGWMDADNLTRKLYGLSGRWAGRAGLVFCRR